MMIRQGDAKKVWKSDTPVIRRGDKGWTSDRPDRRGESAGQNPMAPVRFRKVDGYDDMVGRHPTYKDEVATYEDGSDIVCVIAREGSEGGLFWRHRWRYRNAVHHA